MDGILFRRTITFFMAVPLLLGATATECKKSAPGKHRSNYDEGTQETVEGRDVKLPQCGDQPCDRVYVKVDGRDTDAARMYVAVTAISGPNLTEQGKDEHRPKKPVRLPHRGFAFFPVDSKVIVEVDAEAVGKHARVTVALIYRGRTMCEHGPEHFAACTWYN